MEPVTRKKHAGGRPEKWTADVLRRMAKELLEWMEADEDRLFVKEFAFGGYSYMGKFDPTRLWEFADKSAEFSCALNSVKAIAETRLAKGALVSAFNPYFAGLTLKNIAGWRDKENAKVDVTKDGDSVSISIDV